jgi:DNA-binding NtrC family response regulator
MSREFPGNVRELKQECERLLSEKGEDIFYKGKRAQDLGIVYDLFDYERFCEEFFLWEKHLSPIIRKYKLDFRYKYFPLPEKTAPQRAQSRGEIDPSPDPYDFSTESESLLFRKLLGQQRDFDSRVRFAWSEMPKVIKKLQLRENDQESVILFDYFLHTFLEIPDLNSLLHTFPGHTKTPNQKPDMRGLLDFNPKEATRLFQKIYYTYALRKHKGSIADVAKALKINQNTFKSTLRALSKTVNKITPPGKPL